MAEVRLRIVREEAPNQYRLSLFDGGVTGGVDQALAPGAVSEAVYTAAAPLLENLVAADGSFPTIPAQKAGEALFGVLAQAGVAKAWLERIAKATAEQPLATYLELDQHTRGIPWELVSKPDEEGENQSDFLALRNGHSIVRLHQAGGKWTPERLTRLLIVIGDTVLDAGPPAVAAGDDEVLIERAFQDANCSLHLEVLPAPRTVDELRDRIQTFRPHILHFIGHGFIDAQKKASLVFQDGWLWGADRVGADLIRANWMPPVVVLNACSSAESAAGAASMARAFVRAGVMAVAGMQARVQVDNALLFTKHFYRTLALGKGLDAAVRSVRDALFDKDAASAHWALPQLTVAAIPSEILDLRPYPKAIFECPERQELCGKFVGRREERWRVLRDFGRQPQAMESPGLLVIGTNDAGKSWAVKRCLPDLAHMGLQVRYCEVGGGSKSHGYLDVLRALRRGRENPKSYLFHALPDAPFADFDQTLIEIDEQAAASGENKITPNQIKRLFAQFVAGVRGVASPEAPLLLVLDHFHFRETFGLPPAHFKEILFPFLIEPMLQRVGAGPPEARIVLIMTDDEARDVGLCEIRNGQLVSSLAALPLLRVQGFPTNEAEPLFLEYCRYRKHEKLKKVWEYFRFVIDGEPTWLPVRLKEIQNGVSKALKEIPDGG